MKSRVFIAHLHLKLTPIHEFTSSIGGLFLNVNCHQFWWIYGRTIIWCGNNKAIHCITMCGTLLKSHVTRRMGCETIDWK